MFITISRSLQGLRGTLRLRGEPAGQSRGRAHDFELSGESAGSGSEPSWLAESRKLIPGEAIAGYISLQPIAATARQPNDARVVLAIVFCLVTIILRWYGSQDPTAARPPQTVQIGVVVISMISYVLLVYATGGQIVWHKPIPDQSLYAQIGSAALGILGPTIYRNAFAGK